MSTKTVCKSNALVQAGYKLDLNEQRIILDCISQVNSIEKLLKEDSFEVTAQSMIDNWGVNPSNAYRDLEKAVDTLFERYITINLSENQILKTRWISSIKYSEQEGSVEICFAQKILPYLSQLKQQFTKYKLKHVSKMKSSYGIRLYELLIQYKNIGSRECDIAWLREQFQLVGKYKSIKDFKLRVIEPALRDINGTSDIWVSYTQRKTGRRVTHFTFEFGLKETPQKKPKQLTKKYIEQNSLPGESWENAKERLSGVVV